MLNHPDSRLVEKKIMWIGLFRYRLFPKICLCSCYRLNITMHFAVGSTGRSNVTNHILGRDCILVPGPVHNLCLLCFESLWGPWPHKSLNLWTQSSIFSQTKLRVIPRETKGSLCNHHRTVIIDTLRHEINCQSAKKVMSHKTPCMLDDVMYVVHRLRDQHIYIGYTKSIGCRRGGKGRRPKTKLGVLEISSDINTDYCKSFAFLPKPKH